MFILSSYKSAQNKEFLEALENELGLNQPFSAELELGLNGCNSTELKTTLKEITDLIGVQHSKAMEKVKKLAEEPSFGVLSKMAITSSELGGRPTETYVLNKKQAIAVGARLNNSLLMSISTY
jgi:hypothetical protein